MRLNDFSVRVVGGNEVAGGYVEMQHKQTYKLCMHNYRNVDCDAKVMVDGKHVGTWRIEAHRAITLERPAHDHGEFTFYKLGTKSARKAGLVEGDELGLVSVEFVPEFPWCVPCSYPSYWWEATPAPADWIITSTTDSTTTTGTTQAPGETMIYASCSAGGTGLSGHSAQEFSQARPLTHNYSKRTTIHLRLVCGDNGPRPLTQLETPIPPAVKDRDTMLEEILQARSRGEL